MAGGSSECGASGELEKTEKKRGVKNSKSGRDAKLEEQVNGKSVQVPMGRGVRDDRSNVFFVSNERSQLTEGTIEPGVHRALTDGLASILASISVIPSFARRPVASEPRIDQLAEASTSTGARRSILRENDFSTSNSEPNRFFRVRQFWARYPTKEAKKSIIFLDQRMSDSSLESVVTLIGTSKPLLKSALRSTGSLRSVSSSVRFSLPPESLRQEDNALMKIGKWEIVCDVSNDEITDGWIATWRSLGHTRLCKIVMCLTFGLIVPSFLVVPILVYEDATP